jgi:predicted PurR-regulated permease PerM
MSVFIKSYKKLFPARQLLIRQNGEVKHVVLAPWLQLFAIVLILATLVWVSISSFRVYTQTNHISDIEKNQLNKQALWEQKVSEQQRLHEQQLKQLVTLEQKQALLQSMIESLPASISQDVIQLKSLSHLLTKIKTNFMTP